MKKLIFTGLFVLIMTIGVSDVKARSWGTIDKVFDYDDLKIEYNERKDPNICYISGSLINKTNEMRVGVFFSIYAYTIHGTFLWKELIWFDVVPARGNGEATFSEAIYGCTDDSPYKLKFKVNDYNK